MAQVLPIGWRKEYEKQMAVATCLGEPMTTKDQLEGVYIVILKNGHRLVIEATDMDMTPTLWSTKAQRFLKDGQLVALVACSDIAAIVYPKEPQPDTIVGGEG